MDLVSVFCYADNRLVLFCFFVVFFFWFIFLYLAGIFSFVYSGHFWLSSSFLLSFLASAFARFSLFFLVYCFIILLAFAFFRVLSATNLFWIRRCRRRRWSFSFFRYPLLDKKRNWICDCECVCVCLFVRVHRVVGIVKGEKRGGGSVHTCGFGVCVCVIYLFYIKQKLS